MLVRYCPGSASGSPAWLVPTKAQMLLGRDTALLAKLEQVCGLQSPVSYPHIGGTCNRCRPTRDLEPPAPRGHRR